MSKGEVAMPLTVTGFCEFGMVVKLKAVCFLAVLHEIYHAYLDAQDGLPFNPETDLEPSHEYMMQHYTDDIAAALKTMFPSLDDATATALALGGYGDVQNINPTFWNTTLSNNHVTNAQVTHVNTYYENGSEGTLCH